MVEASTNNENNEEAPAVIDDQAPSSESSWIFHDFEMDEYFVKLRSPINIALVKYWGKAHDDLIIPTNSSLSLTINKKQWCSRTTLTLFSTT